MLKYLAVMSTLLLAGCKGLENPDYHKAKDIVLCDPKTHEAFYVRGGLGDTSFVMRNANLDGACK